MPSAPVSRDVIAADDRWYAGDRTETYTRLAFWLMIQQSHYTIGIWHARIKSNRKNETFPMSS